MTKKDKRLSSMPLHRRESRAKPCLLSRQEMLDLMRYLGYPVDAETPGTITDAAYATATAVQNFPYGPMLVSVIAQEYLKHDPMFMCC